MSDAAFANLLLGILAAMAAVSAARALGAL